MSAAGTEQHETLAARSRARLAVARRFFRTRLGTLLAIAPLGVWTVAHLWHNLYAFAGGDAWQTAVTEYSSPLAGAVTAFVVLAPLVFHTIWGVGRLLISRPNTVRYSNYANLKYLLQRLSALGVLAFLGAHLWLAYFKPRLTLGHAEHFADIAHQMRFHTPTLVVYVLGTLGVSYHLANGVQTAGMKLGFGWSRRFTDPLERPYLILFVLLLAMSWGAIFALWRAGV